MSFPARRGDNIANLAQGRPATASSTQFLTSNTPDKAVDGSLGSRWASSYNDNQWLRVDLGAARTVSRAVLRWEAAYGTGLPDRGLRRRQLLAAGVQHHHRQRRRRQRDLRPGQCPLRADVRVKRATSYGFSLYEFELYGR